MNEEVEIIPFDESLSTYFKDLNVAWLQKYFYVEPIDEEIFAHPREYILDKGGYIFFARYGNEIVGTCALMKSANGDFELAKMAVDEKFQGKKIGHKLMEASIKKAKEMGLSKIMLYSNTKLAPAIHLYRKFGFVELPIDTTGYKRSNIKMEKDLTNIESLQNQQHLTPNPSPGGEGNLNFTKSEVDYLQNMNMEADPILFQYAREGRKDSTEAERILWEQLRNRRLNNLKFRRQHPIDKYIADFYCHEKALVIEIDGGIHERPEMKQYDEARDQHFSSLNIKVLRVKNKEVIEDIKSVLQKINTVNISKGDPNSPLLMERGRGEVKPSKGEILSRVQQLFQQKSQQILNIYCTAGYPQLNSTLEVMNALQQNGADIIELGIPYSDPLADGPVIQESGAMALKNGMTIAKLFEQLIEFRENIHVPVVLMGYLNPLLQYGFEKFCAKAASVGIDGLIIPDIPMYEFENEYSPIIKRYGLDFIFLVTPETSEERIKKLDSLSTGFLYAVSSSSITGSDKDFSPVEDYLQKLKEMNLQNRILVGFGIKDKTTFDAACRYANGAIIGSAYIKALDGTGDMKEKTKGFLDGILK